MERIVSSAVNVRGAVYTGKRHADAIMAAHLAGEKKPLDKHQGFVTNHGRYVGRHEAFFIAEKAGQIKPGGIIRRGFLYSENLY